jgi:hypothetical protein
VSHLTRAPQSKEPYGDECNIFDPIKEKDSGKKQTMRWFLAPSLLEKYMV